MKSTKSKKSKEFVVVRTLNAGVHCGYLISYKAGLVELRDARRVWYWTQANTLNELATKGPGMVGSKISEPIGKLILPSYIELLFATTAAEANLIQSRWG